MEIIEELEGVRRGPYGGAVGYFSYDGSMDMCITIRAILLNGDQAYIQAGAGIVADSDPATEHQECRNKAQAAVAAIDYAERGLI
jgi:anthranilate synthase component 1